jgi:hypothetical protein
MRILLDANDVINIVEHDLPVAYRHGSGTTSPENGLIESTLARVGISATRKEVPEATSSGLLSITRLGPSGPVELNRDDCCTNRIGLVRRTSRY